MITDWRTGTWACLDIETTGVGDEDCIVEIAITIMHRGECLDVWHTLVNPMMPIPSSATAVHGITDEMVRDLPTIESHRAKIEDLLDKACVVVAYNGFHFDFPRVDRELPGIFAGRVCIDPFVVVRSVHVGKWWKSDYIDRSCPICDEDKPEEQRASSKPSGRHSLVSVAERLLVAGPETGFEAVAHRAAWDALLCGRVLWAVCRYCSPDAAVCERKLRVEKERQDAEREAWRERMRAEDEAKRERRKTSQARRIAELEAEVQRLCLALDEVAIQTTQGE